MDRRISDWLDGQAVVRASDQFLDATRRRINATWQQGVVELGSSGRDVFAANDRVFRPRWKWSPTPQLGALVVVALLVAALILGAMSAGGLLPLRDQSPNVLGDDGYVLPFLGLPPDGAPASGPETGEMILKFDIRLRPSGSRVILTVYADGRLIWHRNDRDWSGLAQPQTSEPTYPLIEQRLTPEGAEFIRAQAMVTGAFDQDHEGPMAGSIWAYLTVLDRGRLIRYQAPHAITGDLPGIDQPQVLAMTRLREQLLDLSSWLPATAWLDQRLRGYVARSYFVCFGSDVTEPEQQPVLELSLPQTTRNLLASRAESTRSDQEGCPYRVSTSKARALASSLTDAGLERTYVDLEKEPHLAFRLPPSRTGAYVMFAPVMPNGEPFCYCGG
jgi:hypothetical protein